MTPTISLEDHFISKALQSSGSAANLRLDTHEEEIRTKVLDIGDGRVADLDRGGISLQVISSVPCNESADICRQTNLQLAEAVNKHPTRFAGFACLPMKDPQAAIAELEYCVREQKFLGALIPCHADGIYYERDEYLPFWEKVQELDTVIYIHPAAASALQRQYYQGNYPDYVGQIMGMQVWGWHADVATHVIRLYASGLFDKLPKLKIVVGHMGEMLPFMKERIEYTLTRTWGAHKRGWKTVWEENLWFTTSMFDLNAMACLLRAASTDRVMYSGDSPLVPIMEGKIFIEDLTNSGLLNGEELEKVLYRNAERLLGVTVKS